MEKILFHKYELIRKIGAGGAGRVYLALDRHLNRLVAVKESSGAVSLKEMELLKELEHPGLPKVYDYFKEEESVWLVMEYIEGMTLRQYLDRHRRVKEGQAVTWMLELCRILKYLHGRHPAVIYRDLKPENIMIRQDGTLKLIDLGGAIHYACGSANEKICAGTPGYCPEEQWKGRRGETAWDIYAFGAVFHEMLTGDSPAKPPYERRPLSEYDKSLTPVLNKFIACCTGDKGAARYQTMEQAEEALLGYQKRKLPVGLFRIFKKLLMAGCMGETAAGLALPLLNGIPEDQIPFPYLAKPLFFLMVTLILSLIFSITESKKSYLVTQEKNLWLTEKKFSGLLLFFLILGAGVLFVPALYMAELAAYAEEEPEQLWVEMRDEYGRKLLLKEDAVYITNSSVRFELPTACLPEEEFSLQMVAIDEEGNTYISRIFRIRPKRAAESQQDLN